MLSFSNRTWQGSERRQNLLGIAKQKIGLYKSDFEAFFDTIMAENNRHCVPPLKDKEIYSIVREVIMQGEPLPIIFCKNAADLDFSETPNVKSFIPNILTEGLSMINAPPKGGKSRMLLQMALALCKGQHFMGRPCKKTSVLYLALEDERQDFENRLRLFLNNTPPPDNLYYATLEDFNYQPPTLEADHLIHLLEENISVAPSIEVIMIDVFGTIRSKQQKGENFTDHERRDIQTLVRFSAKHRIALLIAHHVSKTSKRQGNIEAIGSGAGSYVIAGSVHAEMLLMKGQNGEHQFSLEGRRIPSQRFAVLDDYPRWRYAGGLEEYQAENDPLIQTIKQLVQDNNGKWKGNGKRIQEANEAYGFARIPKAINKNTFTSTFQKRLAIAGIGYRQIQDGNGTKHEFYSL